MSVWAVCMCKDELDIIRTTVSLMLEQVDAVIVADNGSTDGTRQILDDIAKFDADRLWVINDPDPAYYQSAKMSHLAELAAEQGAEWVVPFDADEVWGTNEGTVAVALQAQPDCILVAEAPLFDHVPTSQDRPGEPVSSTPWRRAEPAPLRKVACRATGVTIHQGNHGASYPDIASPPSVTNVLEVRHFPYRSVEQMIRKARNGAAAYAATDLGEDVGAHWRQYGRFSDEEIGDVFRKWFWSADPEADGLIYDPA